MLTQLREFLKKNPDCTVCFHDYTELPSNNQGISVKIVHPSRKWKYIRIMDVKELEKVIFKKKFTQLLQNMCSEEHDN